MATPPRPEDDQLTIKVNGAILGGWLRTQVRRGVERLPSDVEINFTDRDPTTGQSLAPPAGSSCEVFLGADKILTGYVDRRVVEYGKDSHSLTLVARSKTADLVDCSVDVRQTGYVFQAATIGAAARKLGAPYNIDVVLPDGDATLPISYFPISPGETAYVLLEEMARSVGMLLWDDANGNLVISKGGTGGRSATALVEGQNVEAVGAVSTMDQRFKDYLVLAQASNEVAGHTNARGEAHDNQVPRNRLKIILQETPGLGVPASTQRAQWEAARRYGQSQQVRVTVTGWRTIDGKLWTPNKVVSVQLPSAFVSADLVIADAMWRRGEGGTSTIMTLMPKQGLLPQPLVFLPQIGGVGLPAPH